VAVRDTRLACAYSAELAPARHSFTCAAGAGVGAVFDAADMRGSRGRPAWRGQLPRTAPDGGGAGGGDGGGGLGMDERALILHLHNVGLVVRSSKGSGGVGSVGSGSGNRTGGSELVLPKRVEGIADLMNLTIGFRGRGRVRPPGPVRERNRLLFRSAVCSLRVDTAPPPAVPSMTVAAATAVRGAPSLPPDVRATGWVDLSGFDIRLDATGVESAATFGSVWAAALPRGAGASSPPPRPGSMMRTPSTALLNLSPSGTAAEAAEEDLADSGAGAINRTQAGDPSAAAAGSSLVGLTDGGRRRMAELTLRLHALPGTCSIDPKTAYGEWARSGPGSTGEGGGGAGGGGMEPALLCVPLPDFVVTARVGLLLPGGSDGDGGGTQVLRDNVVAVRVEMPIKDGVHAEVRRWQRRRRMR
jgi:hypothetical protein